MHYICEVTHPSMLFKAQIFTLNLNCLILFQLLGVRIVAEAQVESYPLFVDLSSHNTALHDMESADLESSFTRGWKASLLNNFILLDSSGILHQRSPARGLFDKLLLASLSAISTSR